MVRRNMVGYVLMCNLYLYEITLMHVNVSCLGLAVRGAVCATSHVRDVSPARGANSTGSVSAGAGIMSSSMNCACRVGIRVSSSMIVSGDKLHILAMSSRLN